MSADRSFNQVGGFHRRGGSNESPNRRRPPRHSHATSSFAALRSRARRRGSLRYPVVCPDAVPDAERFHHRTVPDRLFGPAHHRRKFSRTGRAAGRHVYPRPILFLLHGGDRDWFHRLVAAISDLSAGAKKRALTRDPPFAFGKSPVLIRRVGAHATSDHPGDRRSSLRV